MKRRESLRLINSFVLGLGLPSIKTWSKEMPEEDVITFAKTNNIKFLAEENVLANYKRDYGNIYQSTPRAVLLPDSVGQLKSILVFANRNGVNIVPRGAGHSQSGQSLTVKNGVTIDLKEFNKIKGIETDEHGNKTICCDPGTTLRQLHKFALASGYMLPSIPFYQDLTIGGVLSAGGIGTGSHRNGLLISNAVELEIMTADGSVTTCTPSKNKELFYSVLATFGYVGIITKAKLKLIESKKIFRTLRLVYNEIDEWLSDYNSLLATDISNLQGICIKSKENRSVWNYMLEVSLQAETEQDLEKYDDVISKLKFKSQLPSSDYSPESFLDRFESRFEQMRLQNRFEQFHPLLEFVVPADKAKEMIQKAIQTLPASFEDGYRLIFINKKNLPPYFITPQAERICMVAVLPAGIAKEDLDESMKAAEQLHEYAMSIQAKRYLSGWLGMMSVEGLKSHFADKAAEIEKIKKQVDPNNILRSWFSDKFCNFS